MFKVRSFDSKPLQWWFNERDDIDFEPLYQRTSGAWKKTDKQYLIDSIINEFDVPKFYIADFTYGHNALNVNNKKYAVIDGKQRFESVFEFFENKFSLAEDFKLLDFPEINLGGLTYNDLKDRFPKIASRFDTFTLSVMAVVTDNESNINELFLRLNNSKPLKGAEIRNAMQGIIPELIREIVKNEFFKSNVKFSLQGGRGLNTAAKLLYIEHKGHFVDTTRKQLDKFVEDFIEYSIQEEYINEKSIKAAATRVKDVLFEMSTCFQQKDALLRAEGVILPYYWLYRNNKSSCSSIYAFLNEFNRILDISKTDKNIEGFSDFLEYRLQSRNINSQTSNQKRYEILQKYFDKGI